MNTIFQDTSSTGKKLATANNLQTLVNHYYKFEYDPETLERSIVINGIRLYFGKGATAIKLSNKRMILAVKSLCVENGLPATTIQYLPLVKLPPFYPIKQPERPPTTQAEKLHGKAVFAKLSRIASNNEVSS